MKDHSADAAVLLTLITVNRNNATGLARTIRSVLPVLGADVEYLILDGASTDDSVAVGQALLLGETRARLVSEPDAGIYDAMNKGVRMARGKFVAFINSGDELDPAVYPDYMVFIRQSGAQVTYARTHLRSMDGQYLGVHERHPDQLDRDTLPHLTTAVRRDWMLKLGGFDQQYRVCADRDFFVRSRSLGATFAYFDGVVATFELGGLSSSPQTKVEDLRINVQHGFISRWRYQRKRLSLVWRAKRDAWRSRRR